MADGAETVECRVLGVLAWNPGSADYLGTDTVLPLRVERFGREYVIPMRRTEALELRLGAKIWLPLLTVAQLTGGG